MPPNAEAYYADGTTAVVRDEGVVNDPILQCVPLLDGRALPGVDWTLTFSGVSGDDAIVTLSSTNPFAEAFLTEYLGGLTRAVTIDGTTHHRSTVAPGFDLVFRDTVANGDSAIIRGGVYMTVLTAGNPEGKRWSERIEDDTPGLETDGDLVGQEGYIGSFYIKNVGEEQWVDAELAYLPVPLIASTVGWGFDSVDVIDDTVDGINAGPSGGYAPLPRTVYFDSLSGGTVRMRVNDGSGLALVDVVDPSGVPSTSAALEADGETLYRCTSDGLDGWRFIISADVANGDTVKFWVFEPDYGWITVDNGAGGPDETGWTQDSIPLTDDDGEPGYVAVGATVKVHEKAIVPAGAPSKISPFFISPVVIASLAGTWVGGDTP